ncbi:MAG: serine/threonine protein kinase [Ignavibacteria bacterium]|nr:serine/threonine protein kinase [Ignavibacteria bacterium]
MAEQIISNYRIIEKIGEGGMGIVYLAEHITLKRKAAIKVLNPILSQNEQIKARFVNEAVTLSQLNHKSIVLLYDFTSQDNQLFLIMEYADGHTLSEIIERNEALQENYAVNIFKDILSGFVYAHSKGIVHRDIKPSNIIIESNGNPKILDFGIAKILASDAKITKTGMKLGSVSYMSPEQILGKQIDYRTDIFSLGVTLFETLTGKLPFDTSTDSEFEIQSKIVEGNFKSVKTFNPNISDRVQNAIIIATSKNPNDRFQSCNDFKNYLTITNIKQQQFSVYPYVQKTKVSEIHPVTKNKNSKAGYIIVFTIIGLIAITGLILLLTFGKEENEDKITISKKTESREEDSKNHKESTKEKTMNRTEEVRKLNLEGYYEGYADRFGYDPMEMWITHEDGGKLTGSTTIRFSNGKTGTSGFGGVYYSSTGKISLYETKQTSGSGTIEGTVSTDENYIYINCIFTRTSDGGKYKWHLKKLK